MPRRHPSIGDVPGGRARRIQDGLPAHRNVGQRVRRCAARRALGLPEHEIAIGITRHARPRAAFRPLRDGMDETGCDPEQRWNRAGLGPLLQ